MILGIFSQPGDDFPRQSPVFPSPITIELFIRQIRFLKDQCHQFNHATSFHNNVNHFCLGSIVFAKSPLLNVETQPQSFRRIETRLAVAKQTLFSVRPKTSCG